METRIAEDAGRPSKKSRRWLIFSAIAATAVIIVVLVGTIWAPRNAAADQSIEDVSLSVSDFPEGWAQSPSVNWTIYNFFRDNMTDIGGPSFSSNGSDKLRVDIMVLQMNSAENAQAVYDYMFGSFMINQQGTGYKFGGNHTLGYGCSYFHSDDLNFGGSGTDVILCKGSFVVDMRWYSDGALDDAFVLEYADIQGSKIA